MRIRDKLEMRRKEYASRKRRKLVTAIFAMLMTLGIIHKTAVPKTDALFRYNTERSGKDRLTVIDSVYKTDTVLNLTNQNLSVKEAVYNEEITK